METVPSFTDYPLRVYRSRQTSLQSHEFIHDHKKKYRKTIHQGPFTQKQKEFFITLLELSGVIKITITTSQIIVWKWPGFEWYDIEEKIITTISSCPVDQIDLAIQKEILIEKWRKKNLAK